MLRGSRVFSASSIWFFFSSRRRHTRCSRDWSSDVCSSDLPSCRRPARPRSPCGRLGAMAAENSFDIVCKIDMQEVRNALDQARREIETRYDLKGTKNEVLLDKTDIVVSAADDMKLKAVVDILQSRLHKRGVPLNALTYGKREQAGGGPQRHRN